MDGLRLVTMSEKLSRAVGLERRLSALAKDPGLDPSTHMAAHTSASCGLSFKTLRTPGERDAFIRPTHVPSTT